MLKDKEPDHLDSKFYKAADVFFPAYSNLGLTYDDVTLATLYSEVLPRDTQLDTTLAEGLRLNIPVISSDMDTVTESRMATAMALSGGLGLIHYNMPEREQLSEVSRVKNHVHGLIQEPIKVAPDQLIGEVLELIAKKRFAFCNFPVVDGQGKLVGCFPGMSSSSVTPNGRWLRRLRHAARFTRSTRKRWAAIPSPRRISFSRLTRASTSCWWWTIRTGCTG